MILYFHLSKCFLKNLKLFLRSTIPEDFHGRRRPTVSQKTFRGYIRKNKLCFLFGHKRLAVILQDFWVTFAFDSSSTILLQSKSSFESYLANFRR